MMLLLAQSGEDERFAVLDWLEAFQTSPLLLLLALCAATLLSEDLACIAGGIVAAKGWLPLSGAVAACAGGIWVGDLGLYGLGYFIGHKRHHWQWLDRIVSPERIERGKQMFDRYGFWWIVISRFLPGMRLPSYVAAGVVGWSLKTYLIVLAITVWIWTPIICAISYYAGRAVLKWIEIYQAWAWPIIIAIVLLIYGFQKVVLPAFTWRGRLLLKSKWIRLRRWEFWPLWAVYPPVVLSLLWQTLRFRGLTFTAVDPAIPVSGFALESKGDILDALPIPDERAVRVARYARWGGEGEVDEKLTLVREFMRRESLGYPVVLKPDIGERGQGVKVVESEAEVRDWLERCQAPAMVQEYIEGPEFGVQWICEPGASAGEIPSIAQKHLQFVIGDGERRLERLIMEDERAVTMAEYYLGKFASRLNEMPAKGEKVWLASIGTHVRGAVFQDARELETVALREALDAVGLEYEGFFFGRYDLRAPSVEHFQGGRGLVILELNGVTGEPLHVYQPGFSWWRGVRDLARHWERACAIGARNRDAGAHVSSFAELWHLVRRHAKHDWFEADDLLEEADED